MEKINKLGFVIKYWYVLLGVFLAFYMFFSYRYDTPLGEQLMFLLCQIIFVLIPGMALTAQITVFKDKLIYIMVSYMTGIFICIAMYFVFYAFKIQEFLTIGLCVVSLLSMYCLYKKRKTLINMPHNSTNIMSVAVLLIVLCTTVLMIAFRTTRLPSIELGGAFNYYQDSLWNTGNLTAIANGFPVSDIHVKGLSFSYHFLASVFLAVFKNILGISSFLLTFRFLAVLQIITFICAAYPLFSLIIKNTYLRILAIGVVFLASTLLLQHILFVAYASLFALSFAMLAGYFFIKYIKENSKKLFDGSFILFLIMLGVSLGAKSLFGGVLAAACGVVFFANMKSNPKKMLTNGFITMFVVVFVALVMVYGTHTFNALSFQFGTPLLSENPQYFAQAKDVWGDGLNVTALIYPLYLLINQTILILGVIMLLCAIITKKGKNILPELFLLTISVVGLLLASLLFQPGYSNMLFFTAAFPFGVFGCLYSLPTLKRSRKPFTFVMIAVFIFSIIQSLVANVAFYNNLITYKSVPNPYDSITYNEYEALEWLKTNTTTTDVILGDRIYLSPSGGETSARSYYYSAFSERQIYIEGFYYVNAYNKDFLDIINFNLYNVNALYNGDNTVIPTLKAQGVTHILSSSAMTADFILDATYGELVFNNGDVYIYKLH